MKTMFIDCGMGAAGDMLTAALIGIRYGSDKGRIDEFVQKFNSIGIPGTEMQVREDVKQGITGTHVHILVNGEEEGEPEGHDHCHHHHHHHAHRSMADIEALISGLDIDEAIKTDIRSVYHIIAEAEGEVHGMPAGEVHFHEVGTMDALADVTAVCMLIRGIAPDEVIASPVATGYGAVRCAHGIMPVPAPATAQILKGIPAYAGRIEGELCTPTGAALIRYFAQSYSQQPLMSTEAIGYGLGTKDFERANCLRIFLGESFRQI